MKHLIAALAILATSLNAAAQTATPPCWPKQLGSTGSDFKQGTTPDGRWVAWTCTVSGAPRIYSAWAVTDYELVHPVTTGMTPIKTAQAYWRANTASSSTDPRLARLRAAAEASFR